MLALGYGVFPPERTAYTTSYINVAKIKLVVTTHETAANVVELNHRLLSRIGNALAPGPNNA